jgi:nitrate reductase beta subunit
VTGVGYLKDWENQERWKGGWRRQANGARSSPSWAPNGACFADIFVNPDLLEIDDCYEPFTFDYKHLRRPALAASLSRRHAG